ncbi:MAG: S41 family peptidase [Thermoanaerobaculia bacterium]
MRRRWRIVAVTAAITVFLVGGLFGGRLLALTGQAREALRTYTELLTAAHENAAVATSYRDLVYASIGGMLRVLDPHSSFLPPETYSEMRERQQSSFYGLGILVGIRNGQLTVVTPLDGTPASRMGIRAGDVISLIEGEPTESMTLDEAVRKLKGPKGKAVHITVVRAGLDEPLELDIVRDEIPQNTVRQVYMLDDETGYIALSDFTNPTTQEVAQAIARLRGEGMKRLLFDLRSNGGGLLEQAIGVSDIFLPTRSKIVETRGRVRGASESFHDAGEYDPLDMPVIVLVGEATASAAEIVAGALQDHDFALIVGQPTWGKGLVQTVYRLSYDAGLALTTAKYYTPSGRLIQRDYTDYYDYAAHDAAQDGEPNGDNGEIFYTDLGREVYGGGGITPDVLVEPAELPAFLQYLISRDAFFQFAVGWVNRHPLPGPDWQPDDTVLEAFDAWTIEQEITDPEELAEALADPEVRRDVLLFLEAEAKGSQFGLEARSRVLLGVDRQVQTALGHFADAATLLARRQRLNAQDETELAAVAARPPTQGSGVRGQGQQQPAGLTPDP